MLEEYYVFEKETYLGVLSYNSGTDRFHFEQEMFTPEAERGIAHFLGSIEHVQDDEWINAVIEDRVMPPSRTRLAFALAKIGLRNYSAWDIAKEINLFSCNDLVWMSAEKNPLLYYDIHPYARMITTDNKPHIKESKVSRYRLD